MATHPLPVHGDSEAQARPEDLPYTFEAEQGLLGAILVNNRAYELVSDYLSENQFSDPAHGRIYAECARLISRGQLANPVTLKARFDQDESLEAHGGSAYLANLAASVVTVGNAGDRRAVGLHLYSPPIESCQYLDSERRIRTKQMSYFTVNGEPVSA